ncbi:hypothetical protein MNVI_28070 [Mycobacterium noviomagense]|uniref:Uncharacterized protein n=1 Tax=Mycobacterium noviomagense TaxID=459858 RepID=A0A7I7PG41_9MYCO|nr:hypothetical protein [Mycobacterium noviomagense]BBY07489.1 hypothetical protein MNVI_28070 [Mycobacterium noviomagense]
MIGHHRKIQRALSAAPLAAHQCGDAGNRQEIDRCRIDQNLARIRGSAARFPQGALELSDVAKVDIPTQVQDDQIINRCAFDM